MSHQTPDRVVQDLVAGADRRRRRRFVLRAVSAILPWAAGAALVVALVGRVGGLAPAVTVVATVVLVLAVGLYALLRMRSTDEADVVAARVDADAGLAGELRSAHWFATGPRQDEWTSFHLARAAEHAERVDWAGLYPPIRAFKAWAGSFVLVAVAVAVALSTPPPSAPLEAAMLVEDGQLLDAEFLDSLPLELREELEALLEGMADGSISAEVAEATLEELQELMESIDPELSEQLAELAEQAAEAGGLKPPDEDELNANAGMPEDVRWAVEDLASRLANAEAERETNEANPAASEETGEMGAGSDQAALSEATDDSAKLTREAAEDPGASRMIMGGAGAMGGDSRPGAGGNRPGQEEAEQRALIAAVLRQELVEASVDALGENVETEDIRKQTEQGRATVGFTRVAPPTAVDRSRAQAPPVVPDARRLLLYTYFIR